MTSLPASMRETASKTQTEPSLAKDTMTLFVIGAKLDWHATSMESFIGEEEHKDSNELQRSG